jgi:hypothetical protein
MALILAGSYNATYQVNEATGTPTQEREHMKEITAYQCSDGAIFENENKAAAHDEDLLGQEVDGLLKLYGLDITRNQEFKGCLSAMGKRQELAEAAAAILAILNHSKED